jgi:dihydrofolate reductase
MSRVAVINHVTLDGVMQAPGRPDEDRRDEFELGGWSIPNNDDVIGAALGERMADSGGLLLGRRTYEDLLSYWNTQDSPFKDALNMARKYVASRTLGEPLPWPNTALLEGDVADAVAELKNEPGKDLQIMGSGALIQSLMPRGPDRRVPADDPPIGARIWEETLRRWHPRHKPPARRHEDCNHRCRHRDVPAGRMHGGLINRAGLRALTSQIEGGAS